MWLSQVIMLLLTGAVIWLQIVSWEVIGPPLFVFGIMGLLIILLVAALTGKLAIGTIGPREFTVAGVGLVVLVAVNMFIFWVFDVPMSAGSGPVAETSNWFERVLVGVLFAIYEENFMLGLFSAGKAGGVPDLYLIIGAVIVFVPLHAWVRAIDLVFALFLGVGRAVMNAQYASSDHSDPSYITHIVWNIVNA